jgi:hypothetical protein
VINTKSIAKKINFPLSKWPGSCHAIASLLLKHKIFTGKLRYGMWLGKIHPASLFGGRLFTHHGWIEREDGVIIDPTRWVFENVQPYIFIGDNEGEYDFGGNQLHKSFRTPFPSGKGDKLVHFPKPFLKHFGTSKFTADQLMWIANMPLDELGIYAFQVYQRLKGAGFAAFIPIDNRRDVLHD